MAQTVARPAKSQQSLRDAMECARMPARDYRIFGAFLKRADFASGEIPEQFQFRSLEKLTEACAMMSRRSITTGLAHLEQHGWLSRWPMPGRRRATFYLLAFGADCDCPAAADRDEPTSDAQRAREYRARKKASRRFRVTEAESSRGICVNDGAASRDADAGQAPVLAEKAMRGVSRDGEPQPEYRGGAVQPW